MFFNEERLFPNSLSSIYPTPGFVTIIFLAGSVEKIFKKEIQQENAGLRLPDRFGNAVLQIGIACQDKKKIG
jgi:hypothetical protein